MAENMKENLLTIQNLRVEYASGGKTIQAVNGVSLDIPKGASLGCERASVPQRSAR